MKRSRSAGSRKTHNSLLENGELDNAQDIRNDKVLLITNSSVSWSADLADYYIAARSLNPNHVKEFSLGTGTQVAGTDGADAATFYSNVIEDISPYIKANDIDAVICCGVPHKCESLPRVLDGLTILTSTASVLAIAVHLTDVFGGMVARAESTVIDVFGGFTSPSLATSIDLSISYRFCDVYETFTNGTLIDSSARTHRLKHPTKEVIAYGSLGIPLTFTTADFNLAKRCISDAIIKTSGTVHVGMQDRITTNSVVTALTAYQSERVRQLCVKYGVPVRHFIEPNGYNADWPEQPPPASYDSATMLAGTLDPVEDAWGMCGSGIDNEAVGAPYINSYNWVQGSWGYEATSIGMNLVRNMINNGACAGVGTWAEPQSSSVPIVDAFMQSLLSGQSMATAMLVSRINMPWYVDCWGDPLYRPFA